MEILGISDQNVKGVPAGENENNTADSSDTEIPGTGMPDAEAPEEKIPDSVLHWTAFLSLPLPMETM